MCKNSSYLAQAQVAYTDGQLDRSLYLYSIFQKENPELAKFVEFNIKKISMEKEDSLKNCKKIVTNDINRSDRFCSSFSPKISVIVPVYNCYEYLQDCINSLISQTLKDAEFIFIDDGSCDASLDILKMNKMRDRRVIIIEQKNKFAGIARNNGLKKASGEYILFLDSDDFFDLKLLEKVYNTAISSNAEIVIFKGQEYDNKTKQFMSCKFPLSESLFPSQDTFAWSDFPDKIFQANSCIAWNKLFKRSLIDRAQVEFQDLKSSNDTVFVYSLLVQAKTMTFLDEVLVNYRVNNSSSLQRSKAKTWECIFLAFYALKLRLEQIKMYDFVKKSFLNKTLRAICYYMDTVDSSTARIMECSFKNKYMNKLDMRLNIVGDYFYNKSNYEKLKNIQNANYVPIIYACDKGYLPHTYVSIKSILNNISKHTYVIIYILHDNSISQDDIVQFKPFISENCVISFINMEKKFNNVKLKIQHTSKATYYRLEISKIFSFYDKVIYLDSDIIVNCEISELYNINILDYYAAGVKAIAFDNKHHRNRLGIDTSKYFNAGVMLLNVSKIIHDNIYDEFHSLLAREFSCQDQDIMNVAFNGNVKLIDKNFNFMTKYIDNYDCSFELFLQPKIIHYADKIKPWNCSRCPLSDYFWKIAKSTPYYKELVSGITNNVTLKDA